MPGRTHKTYKEYVKAIKARGGKQIATKAEWQKMKARMSQQYPERSAMAKTIVKKARNKYAGSAYPLVEYAKQTGKPEVQGVRGQTKKDVEKLLYGKKKK